MAALGALVQRLTILGGYGRSVVITEGQYLRIVDFRGKDPCSLIVINPAEPRQLLSGSYTRVYLSFKLEADRPTVPGERLLDDTRAPMLVCKEDTFGLHDWLLPACDVAYYSWSMEV
jgi:uncharacterized protein YcgI (DUF1989 family)